MTNRTGMSQVKFQVRHNALMLREFTAADMIRATGLNPESVRTELQRMKQEGLLISEAHPDKAKKKRGGPPFLYKLTIDREARLSLFKSIEAFYPSPPPSERPTSRHYILARQLLDQAHQTADDSKRRRLLDNAERDLEMAEHAEGGGLAPETVTAYLKYERARLLYLRGKRGEARNQFDILRDFFIVAQDEDTVNRIDEYRLCLNAYDRFATEMTGRVGEAALARCLLATLAEHDYQTGSPLISLLLQLLRDLSETAYDKIRAALLDAAVEAGQRRIKTESIEDFYPDLLQTYERITVHFERTSLPAWPQREENRPIPVKDWPRLDDLTGHALHPPRRPKND